MTKRIIVTVEEFGQDFSKSISEFSNSEIEFVQRPLPVGLNDSDTLIKAAKGFDAVIAGGENWSCQAMEGLMDSLKIIARFGSGYDKIDLPAARRLGIVVTNAPGMFADAVAESTLGLLLSVSRKIAFYDREVRSGIWQPCVTNEIKHKTIGLIGFGAIAKEFVRLLRPFKNTIYAYDVEADSGDQKKYGVEFRPVDFILEAADVVSLHAPLTRQTRGMVDKGFLAKMKRGAILINTSRGGVINEKDLAEALRSGQLAGAGLDVFEKEPIRANNLLLDLENVVINPHSASLTQEAFHKTFACCVQSIEDVFAGRRPKCKVEE